MDTNQMNIKRNTTS